VEAGSAAFSAPLGAALTTGSGPAPCETPVCAPPEAEGGDGDPIGETGPTTGYGVATVGARAADAVVAGGPVDGAAVVGDTVPAAAVVEGAAVVTGATVVEGASVVVVGAAVVVVETSEEGSRTVAAAWVVSATRLDGSGTYPKGSEPGATPGVCPGPAA
jgi:hypothetical protein